MKWEGLMKNQAGKYMVFYQTPLGPDSKCDFGFFDTAHLLSRILVLRATFRAVLIAVDMPKALHNKCKMCFECPRIILQAP